VLSVDPLRVYLAKEGMARLCSEQYKQPETNNLKEVYSHLTNYSLNKKNEKYVFTAATGASVEEAAVIASSAVAPEASSSDGARKTARNASVEDSNSSAGVVGVGGGGIGVGVGGGGCRGSNEATPMLPLIPVPTDAERAALPRRQSTSSSSEQAASPLPSPSKSSRPSYSAVSRRAGKGKKPPTAEALSSPIYVNGDVAKDYMGFSGLFPTIANKLVQRQPFKNLKELYSLGLDTEEERARLQKYERHIVFEKPDKTTEEAAGKSPARNVKKQQPTSPQKALIPTSSISARRAVARSNSPKIETKKAPREHDPSRDGGESFDSVRRNTETRKCGDKADDEESEEDEVDPWLEDSDGPIGSKRRLADVLPILAKPENGGLQEADFWKQCSDLVAKMCIAFQPTLALQYRARFPRKHNLGRSAAARTMEEDDDGADDDDDDDDDNDDDDDDDDDDENGEDAEVTGRSGGGKSVAPKRSDKSSKKEKEEEEKKKKKKKAAAPSRSRPKMLDEPPDEDQDGDDSFRCFHVLGVDVLLDTRGEAHLLEVNSNPSLNIMHDAKDPTTGKLVTEVSPVDEHIKMTVVRDMLRLAINGTLPRDDDKEALGTFLPVVTSATEGR
jgi:hypothetical protein